MAIVKPSMQQLIGDTPDTVRWLRTQMTSTAKTDDSEGSNPNKGGSKPPFRVSMMDAADREVTNLAHWLTEYGVPLKWRLWRVNGEIRGLFGDDYTIVVSMASTLQDCVDSYGELEGMYAECWSVRSQHYASWPALAGLLESIAEPTVEQDDSQGELF